MLPFGRIKTSVACQTLQKMMDAKNGQSQTASIKKIFEDYEDQKKAEMEAKAEAEAKANAKAKADAEAQKMKDPKYKFKNSQELKNVLSAAPSATSLEALATWNKLGPLSVDTIIQNSSSFIQAINPEDIEFKEVVIGDWTYTGFHKKGTTTEHGICR